MFKGSSKNDLSLQKTQRNPDLGYRRKFQTRHQAFFPWGLVRFSKYTALEFRTPQKNLQNEWMGRQCTVGLHKRRVGVWSSELGQASSMELITFEGGWMKANAPRRARALHIEHGSNINQQTEIEKSCQERGHNGWDLGTWGPRPHEPRTLPLFFLEQVPMHLCPRTLCARCSRCVV